VNDVYLSEVNFWRYFLAGGRPQLVLNFGDQSAVIDTRLADFEFGGPAFRGRQAVQEPNLRAGSVLLLRVERRSCGRITRLGGERA